MDILDNIKLKIEQVLPGAVVEVHKEASQHRGQHRAGAHVGVLVKYGGFKGKSLVEQHRMIYKILEPELQQEIHSLQITTEVQ